MSELVLRNARLVYADGSTIDGGLVARDGTIVEVFDGEASDASEGAEVLDAEGRYVVPGAIDPHVQLYAAPEYAHYATETRSAAIGGVTTILKMHRDLEGYEREAFWAEVEAAERRAHIDFGFHVMVMSDEQIASIPDYARDFELTSFKALMAYKGEEGYRLGIQGIDDAQLLAAFRAAASVGGVMLVHCENQEAREPGPRWRARDRPRRTRRICRRASAARRGRGGQARDLPGRGSRLPAVRGPCHLARWSQEPDRRATGRRGCIHRNRGPLPDRDL